MNNRNFMRNRGVGIARDVDKEGITVWVTVIALVVFVFCVIKIMDSLHDDKKIEVQVIKKPTWTGQ